MEDEESDEEVPEEAEEGTEEHADGQHTPPAQVFPVKPTTSRIRIQPHPAKNGSKKKVNHQQAAVPIKKAGKKSAKSKLQSPIPPPPVLKKQKPTPKPPPARSSAKKKKKEEPVQQFIPAPPFHSTLSLFICQVCHGSVFINRTIKKLSNESYNVNLTLCRQ